MSIFVPRADGWIFESPDVEELDFIATPKDWCQISENGSIEKDESKLHFVHLPENMKVKMDLPDDELNALTAQQEERNWVVDMKAVWSSKHGSFHDSEFVFDHDWTLTELMMLPFRRCQYKKTFTLHILKSNGKIYIQKKKEKWVFTDFVLKAKQRKILFEQNLLSYSRNDLPDTNKTDEKPRIRTVVEYLGTLDQHKIHYFATVKGFNKEVDLTKFEDAKFTQIKKFCKLNASEVHWHVWISCWSRMVISREEKMIAGFLDGGEGVNRLKIYDPAEVLNNYEKSWMNAGRKKAPSKYLFTNFLNDFLTFLKVELQNSRPHEIHQFVYDAEKSPIGRLELYGETSEVPAWFIR